MRWIWDALRHLSPTTLLSHVIVSTGWADIGILFGRCWIIDGILELNVASLLGNLHNWALLLLARRIRTLSSYVRNESEPQDCITNSCDSKHFKGGSILIHDWLDGQAFLMNIFNALHQEPSKSLSDTHMPITWICIWRPAKSRIRIQCADVEAASRQYLCDVYSRITLWIHQSTNPYRCSHMSCGLY